MVDGASPRPASGALAAPTTSTALSRWVPNLTAGLLIGTIEVLFASSFAALVFSGVLAEHLPAGIGVALFTAMATMAGVALLSSLRATVGSIQDITAAIFALMAVALAERLGDQGAAFSTVIVAIGFTTIVTGALFLLLGTFRLGDLVRFVPHPVVGGFLAGTGWLLAKGGLGVLAGVQPSLSNLADLFDGGPVARWIPGLAFGLLLLFLSRRYRNALLIPAALLVGLLLFFAALFAVGASPGEARADGWLFGPFPDERLWRPWTFTAFDEADWGAIFSQGATLATLVILALLALLLNASAIELAVGRDVDLNRELRAAGVANVASGLGAGMVGFHTLSLSSLAHRMGARSRLVGLVGAGVCGVALLIGPSLFSLFPRTIVGGLLLFLGAGFLVEWVYDAWFKLPRSEYVVVLLILLAIATLGFLFGVAIGVALAIVLFVVNYSRTNVIKHALSGASYRSKIDRSASDRDALRERGAETEILELQGFIFFGTATSLLDRIRGRAHDPRLPPLRSLVLDFRRVTGLDSSAVLSFEKVHKLGRVEGFQVVFTSLPVQVQRQLERAGLTDQAVEGLRTFPDLDRGVEWCEDRVLAEAGAAVAVEARPLVVELGMDLGVEAERLLPFFERVEVPEGQEVIRQGAPSDELYFLESGRLTAILNRERGSPVRLRTMGPGTVVGEVALYLGTPRNASVVTERPSVLYRLSSRALREMEEHDPQLAAAVHRLFARLLAERLTDTLETLKALLD